MRPDSELGREKACHYDYHPRLQRFTNFSWHKLLNKWPDRGPSTAWKGRDIAKEDFDRRVSERHLDDRLQSHQSFGKSFVSPQVSPIIKVLIFRPNWLGSLSSMISLGSNNLNDFRGPICNRVGFDYWNTRRKPWERGGKRMESTYTTIVS